jgi:hypothetical protein
MTTNGPEIGMKIDSPVMIASGSMQNTRAGKRTAGQG